MWNDGWLFQCIVIVGTTGQPQFNAASQQGMGAYSTVPGDIRSMVSMYLPTAIAPDSNANNANTGSPETTPSTSAPSGGGYPGYPPAVAGGAYNFSMSSQ